MRRVQCSGCAQAFETEGLRETRSGGIDLPRPHVDLSRLRIDPQSRAFRLATIPVAAAAVIGGLLLLQGDDAGSPGEVSSLAGGGTAAEAEREAAAGGEGRAEGAGTGAASAEEAAEGPAGAKLVRGSSYALALPAGWVRTEPAAGATFAAEAQDGGADATLWVTRDPQLDFPTFITRSLEQLRALAGSAEIVERVPAPTPEASVVRLAADAPEGQPTYEVLLRASGPYRYYLATTIDPDASDEARSGAELVVGSFTPSGETGS